MNWHRLVACGTIALASALMASACVAYDEEDEQATVEDLGADTAALLERESRPVPAREVACDPRDRTRRYISHSPRSCAAIRFRCEDGEEPFFDECGCGCQPARR